MVVRWHILGIGLLLSCSGILAAQESAPLPQTTQCESAILAEQTDNLAQLLPIDFERDPQQARDNLYRLGAIYQNLAIQCGYLPSEVETQSMIQQVLQFAQIADIIAASSVGSNVDAIIEELQTTRGDLSNGELLYNGMANGLDGTPLGCSGCHAGDTAPATAGTWTRADEIRLLDPILEGYDSERYLVESIVLPNAYVVPNYLPNLMPGNFGLRLDLQMLADLVAYLDSQDQLLDQ